MVTVEGVTDIVTLIAGGGGEFPPAPPQLLVPIAAGSINTSKITTVCIAIRLGMLRSSCGFFVRTRGAKTQRVSQKRGETVNHAEFLSRAPVYIAANI